MIRCCTLANRVSQTDNGTEWTPPKICRVTRTETDRERLGQSMPDMDTAYRRHAAADKVESAKVEARLLAGQTLG